VIRRAIIAAVIAAVPATAVALPVVAVADHAPAAVAQARATPDPSVYCGPGYYPPAQYGGRCVRVKHLVLGKPSIFRPWTWSYSR
jgi:hypothetical protein